MPEVESRIVGRTLLMELNRPERRNALTKGQLQHLIREIRAIEGGRPDFLAVVVTGTNGCFCAGMDVGELTGTSADHEIDDLLHEWAIAVERLPIPVLAAVEGPCIGAGFDLAFSSDMIIASETAVFRLPAVRFGLLYRPEVVADLVRAVGSQATARLLLFADELRADELGRVGMAAEVVKAGAAVQRALELAEGLVDGMRAALAATKELIRNLRRGELDLERWQAVARQLAESEERSRAVAAAKARLLGGLSDHGGPQHHPLRALKRPSG